MWYVYGYDIELYKITESGDLIFVEKKYSSHDLNWAIVNANSEIQRLTSCSGDRYIIAVRDVYMNQVVYQVYSKKRKAKHKRNDIDNYD